MECKYIERRSGGGMNVLTAVAGVTALMYTLGLLQGGSA